MQLNVASAGSSLLALSVCTIVLAALTALIYSARGRCAPGCASLREFMWPQFRVQRRSAHKRLAVLIFVLQSPWLSVLGGSSLSPLILLLTDCISTTLAAWLGLGLIYTRQAGFLKRPFTNAEVDPGLAVIRLALAWPIWINETARPVAQRQTGGERR